MEGGKKLAYVITNKCIDEQYGQCVDVCPADCIHPGYVNQKALMVIDPKQCVCCDACLQVCPIGAIISDESKDPDAAKLNAILAPKFIGNPDITRRSPKSPPNRKENKLIYP